uniref:Uncharacterized protein n=1 Tax=Arundo donax TaxID=35708 RepID=A0A0A9QLK5_ARUDO
MLLLLCSSDAYSRLSTMQATVLSRHFLSEALRRTTRRNVRNLIGVLFTVKPDVASDPTFLERSVLLKGTSPATTPEDLTEGCFALDVKAAVIVRDSRPLSVQDWLCLPRPEKLALPKTWHLALCTGDVLL